MKNTWPILLLVVLLPFVFAACGDDSAGGGGSGGGDDGAGAMDAMDAMDGMDGTDGTDETDETGETNGMAGVATLDQDTIDRYVATLKDLKALGTDLGAEMEGSSTEIGKAATALKANARLRAATEKHGFAWEQFLPLHMKVMSAMNLARMKTTLPPAQYEQMKSAMGGAMGGSVSDEEAALVEKNEEKIQAALK